MVTDDATKSFELLLLGPQANLFEIAGDSLYLKAGTSIDFETFSQISTQISTFEPDLIGSQSITREFILAVGDVNEAPSAITLSTELPFIPEGPIEEQTLVASFSIDDDAIGTNVVTVSGDGSDLFEIDGNNLYLKAGVTLDFETKSLYDITVGAADEAVPGSTAVSASLSLEVLDVNYIQTAIEARGAVEFGTDSEGNLYAGDSPITFADAAVQTAFRAWEIVEADTVDGQNIVYGRHTSGHLHRLPANESWALYGMERIGNAASIVLPSRPTPVSAPSALRAPIELNGSVGLFRDGLGQLYAATLATETAAQPTPLAKDGSPVTQSPEPGYQAIAVETVDGINQLLLRNHFGQLKIWQFSVEWVFESESGPYEAGSTDANNAEIVFGIDATLDGGIGS